MQRIVLSVLMLSSVAFAAPKVDFKNACVPLAQFSKSQKKCFYALILQERVRGLD